MLEIQKYLLISMTKNDAFYLIQEQRSHPQKKLDQLNYQDTEKALLIQKHFQKNKFIKNYFRH